jgi:hypothetical protein
MKMARVLAGAIAKTAWALGVSAAAAAGDSQMAAAFLNNVERDPTVQHSGQQLPDSIRPQAG